MSKSESSTKYNKENTTTFLLRCNNKTDSEIINHLNQQENKNGYIKGLILKDYHCQKISNKFIKYS